MELLTAVATAVQARGLYGVACSGGADSLALADAAIRAAGGAHVVVVTIDHGLQPGSAEVAASVAAWARAQGASAILERVTCERSEASARAARYAALARLCDRLGLAAMLLGHTARDQAETVLMRIVRGTGPAGLVGIPARRGPFVRPLLRLGREAIDAYCAARGLPVWSDPMNADPAFTRVRMRESILPRLRSENPQLDAALVRLADSAAEWREVIDAAAAPLGRFPLDCGALAAQPAAIRKRALALALDAAGLGVDAATVDNLDLLVRRPAAGQVQLEVPGGVIRRTYDRLEVPRSGRPPPGSGDRCWQPGDRMRPARLKGRSRKLSDLFIDAKVPRHLRATARVQVGDDGEIVWAEYIGEAFKGS